MQTTNTLQYKNYTCQVSYYNVKDCLTGRVLGMSQIPNVTEKFHRAVEEYLLACDSAGKKPAQAFTGNFTVRTTPVIHEALTLYALSQETNLAQIMQQAIGEFLANHDIELPNKEEN